MKTSGQHFFITIIFTFILLATFNVERVNANQIKTDTYKELQSLFNKMDYSWDKISEGVPEFNLHSFPADIAHVGNVRQKKRLFFLSLLPMVIKQNNLILQQRRQLLHLLDAYDRQLKLTSKQSRWLARLGRQYRCKLTVDNLGRMREEILRRVDIVPAALAIAQAANESAYGSSRFAQQANNIFGEWTFKTGTGLVPRNRCAGKTHEIRVFKSLSDSIKSYLKNINTHDAYKTLRLYRAQMRKHDQTIDAVKLAEGLISYSTRRSAYVAEIQKMINYNRLTKLSMAQLRSSSVKLAEESVPDDRRKTVLRLSEMCSRIKAKRLI